MSARTILGLAVGMLAVVRAAGATDHHVSATGSDAGDGTSGSPWDLATAFAQPASVVPGDSILLSGGNYAGVFTSKLAGTADLPITVRSAPGEWARIDVPLDPAPQGSGLVLEGHWVVYKDFEILSSDPSGPRLAGGVGIYGDHQKLVGLVIHDVGNNMLHGNGNEVYGCILYDNGDGAAGGYLGHHLYTQNDDPLQPTTIADSIIANGFAFGVHAYATAGYVSGVHLIGNAWFNAGAADVTPVRKDNCLVGSIAHPPQGIVLRQNMGWTTAPSDRSVALGRYNDTNEDLTLEQNYFVGSTEITNPWKSLTIARNTFYGPLSGVVGAADYPDNTYLAERPSGTNVFVRPSQYDPGRALIVVYNWDLGATVPIDLASVLGAGASFEIRSGQDFMGQPVVVGRYEGSPVDLPMDAGNAPAQPIGPGKIDTGEVTGRGFGVFVLLPSGGGGPLPVDAGSPTPDAGAPGSRGEPDGSTAESSGCACRTGASAGEGATLVLLAALAALARRAAHPTSVRRHPIA